MRADFVGIEARIAWRGILAKFDHEFQRSNTFGTVHGRLAVGVEHFAAKRPEDWHEIGNGGISLRRTHHVTVNLTATGRATCFLFADGFCRRQYIVPGRWFFQVMLLEKVSAIEEQL